MKNLSFIAALFLTLTACDQSLEQPNPSGQLPAAAQSTAVAGDPESFEGLRVDFTYASSADLNAYKVYHHARYKKQTAAQAGGTNTLLHTKKLPTEGTDPVVSPALDHLYTKAILDLSNGPVVLTLPEVDGRYFSLQVQDAEHYSIFDEIQASGNYVFFRKDQDVSGFNGAALLEQRGDHPHVFIRIQIFQDTPEEHAVIDAIQDGMHLTGEVTQLDFELEDAFQWVLDTHEVYPQNEGLLEQRLGWTEAEQTAMFNWVAKFFVTTAEDNVGMFGPIDSTEAHSNDLVYRAAAIIGHLGFPVHHAYYTGTAVNCEGEPLVGGDNYRATVNWDQSDTIDGFWSVSRYSGLTMSTLPGTNDVFNAYNTRPDSSGQVHIIFAPEEPSDLGEGEYWMKVNEGEPYYFVERLYQPKGGYGGQKLIVKNAQNVCGTPLND